MIFLNRFSDDLWGEGDFQISVRVLSITLTPMPVNDVLPLVWIGCKHVIGVYIFAECYHELLTYDLYILQRHSGIQYQKYLKVLWWNGYRISGNEHGNQAQIFYVLTPATLNFRHTSIRFAWTYHWSMLTIPESTIVIIYQEHFPEKYQNFLGGAGHP